MGLDGQKRNLNRFGVDLISAFRFVESLRSVLITVVSCNTKAKKDDDFVSLCWHLIKFTNFTV